MSLQSFRTLYQLSPILLTGGSAANIPGGILPILAISDALSFTQSLIGGPGFDSSNAFANFQPLPNGSLIEQSIAMYPFANQSVAANATIREPLSVSMLMMTPNKSPSEFTAIMTAMKMTFDAHNEAGGLYTVLTPAFMYTNMIFKAMTDISKSDIILPQNGWKLDFSRPLVTLQDAAGAQNSMMNQITNGVPSPGTPSGTSTVTPSTGTYVAAYGGGMPFAQPYTAGPLGAGYGGGPSQ